MLAGQVGLVRNARSWVGRTVEWATDSTSHHVVIAVNETDCVSADLPKVIVRPHREFHSMEWSGFDLTDEQRERVLASALSMVGRPYNVPAIILLLMSKLSGVPIPRFAVKWLESRPELDCSQLCHIAMEAGGLELFPHDASLTVPAHYEQLFLERGWLTAPHLIPIYSPAVRIAN